VIVKFVVDKDGRITDVEITRSVDPSLDKEAMRIVKAMPKWKPGKLKGNCVRGGVI
jgi:periplasmic protein TonB